MFAHIIPLTKIPLSRPQAYTYRAGGFDKDLATGQMVHIPLYNRMTAGIVAALTETAEPNIVYKPIEAISDRLPLLNERDLQLARFASNYYYTPLGIILKHALPSFPKRKIKKVEQALEQMDTSVIAVNTGLPRSVPTAVGTPLAMTKVTLAIGTLKQRQKYYTEIIQNCIQNNTQILFLIPELTLVPQTLDWLKKTFPQEEIVFLHGSLSKSNELIAWRKAQTKAAKIFLGTRRAAFTAFAELGHIIIDEEQDLSYKQWDMNPRFDARTVCEQKAKYYHCPLTFGTAVPSVAAYAKLKNKTYALAALNKSNVAAPLTIVDMRREAHQQNYSLFSTLLTDSLYETLQAGKQAILFVNRRGAFSFLLCRDCGFIPRCPNCDTSLVEHGGRKLACSHCSFKSESPAVCPHCHSTRIRGFGSGVERVQEELVKLFPKKNIARLDVSTATTLKNIREKYDDFVNKKIDVLVGTGIAVRLTAPALELIAAVNMDTILNFPDWRTDEKSWTLVKQMSVREDVRHCIIQTYNPDHAVLRQRKNFYERELANRERFAYPPFVKMMKLICKSDDYNFLQTEADRVAAQLLQILPPESVLGPVEPINAKIRNFWQKHIILKLDFSLKNDIVENVLKNLSNNWSIDVDPLT
jgi:primosomal protein N' (replication factor Y)